MLAYWLISCILLMAAPAAEPKLRLKIGARLNARLVPKTPTNWTTSHVSQFDPCIERSVEGARYRIAYEQKTRRITFLYTQDEAFRTADGLRVGSYIEVTREQIHPYPGWYIFGPATRDGWRPVLGLFFPRIAGPRDGPDVPLNLDMPLPPDDGRPLKMEITGFAKGKSF